MTQGKIDFVVDWVDGNDPKWITEKNKFTENKTEVAQNDINRYRDYGSLVYFFRSVEKNADWVNKIYLVTNGQIPEFLNIDHPKLQLVKHDDYMEKDDVPTFNSNSIEINYHRIKDLSENFVMFNDDMFVNKKTAPDDYFVNDNPKGYGILKATIPHTDFYRCVYNNLIVVNKHFDKKQFTHQNRSKIFNKAYGSFGFKNNLLAMPWSEFNGFYDSHGPQSLKKSTLQKLWDEEPEVMKATSNTKFRSAEDINIWLSSYVQVVSGEFEPRGYADELFTRIDDLKNHTEDIKNEKYVNVCINDDTDDFDRDVKVYTDLMETIFPDKSSFEK